MMAVSSPSSFLNRGPVFKGSAASFILQLKSCAQEKDLCKGSKVHADILRKGFLENDCYVASSLVSMYTKCGALSKAQQVLDELSIRDVVIWNSLIAGYVQQGQSKKALSCFQQMKHDGLSPDMVTFICMLKACGSTGAIDLGKQIHDEILCGALLGKDTVVGNALVDMYTKCGLLEKAIQVLDELPVRDTISWNVLIARYAQLEQAAAAFNCFEQMQYEGLLPDTISLLCILKACASIKDIDKGKQIHDEIIRQDLLHKKNALGNALVDMYAKCGVLVKAQEVFNELHARDVVTWNSLIAGFLDQGQGPRALYCYEQMQREGFTANTVTFVCALKACGSIGELDKGKQIHENIVCHNLLGKDIALDTALIDMYAKCGALSRAQQLLDEPTLQNVVTWNAVITAYAHQGKGEEALDCLQRMRSEYFSPDAVTFISTLKACGCIGAIDKGKEIHNEITNRGVFKDDIAIGNALVDMYAKCDALEEAQWSLDELDGRDVLTWNALITGYAHQGQQEMVLSCIKRMQAEGLSPDAVTLNCALNTCSRLGLMDEGQMVLNQISKGYGVLADVEHHTCMVDLLGRAGLLDNAIAFIKGIQYCGDLPLWSSLLGACQRLGNVSIGKWAFEHAIEIDKNSAEAYIQMANIYVVAGMEEDARERRELIGYCERK